MNQHATILPQPLILALKKHWTSTNEPLSFASNDNLINHAKEYIPSRIYINSKVLEVVPLNPMAKPQMHWG
jgi:hypothetical protein